MKRLMILAAGSAVLAAGNECEWILPAMFPMSFDLVSGMWQSWQPCDLGG